MEIPRDRPIPDDWPATRARDAYFTENGFTLEAYDAPRTEGSFLGVRFTVPNPPRHRWAIMRHDLHHVATGYGTDPAGEGEMAAWELRRGLRPLGLYTGTIVASAVCLGLIVAPRRVVRAWRSSGAGRDSLFHRDAPCEDLVSVSTGALRALLDIPAGGIARFPRGRHSLAPGRRRTGSRRGATGRGVDPADEGDSR